LIAATYGRGLWTHDVGELFADGFETGTSCLWSSGC
jgi:hypothetical protein